MKQNDVKSKISNVNFGICVLSFIGFLFAVDGLLLLLSWSLGIVYCIIGYQKSAINSRKEKYVGTPSVLWPKIIHRLLRHNTNKTPNPANSEIA